MEPKQTLVVNDYLVGSRKWTKTRETRFIIQLSSNWISQDGDCVGLYIEKNGAGFDLRCFSGIPASSIYIDILDFGTLWYKICLVHPETLGITTYSYEYQCIIIADYLCSLFCEYPIESELPEPEEPIIPAV